MKYLSSMMTSVPDLSRGQPGSRSSESLCNGGVDLIGCVAFEELTKLLWVHLPFLYK